MSAAWRGEAFPAVSHAQNSATIHLFIHRAEGNAAIVSISEVRKLTVSDSGSYYGLSSGNKLSGRKSPKRLR